ncbi:MAG: CotH kinase family protein, partial [Pirellulales bacterium]
MAWSPHRVARRLSRKRPVRPRSRAGRFESLENRELLAGDLVLTEFMASNDSTLLDVDGNSSDWIEVHNPTASSISLDGWHLTDDAERLDKWTFPAVELGAGEHLVVFASGEDRAAAGQDLVRDLHATADATFVVDLPNGTYDVEVTVGDYLRARDEIAFSLQGDQVDTLTVGAGRFLVRTYTAQVSGDTNGQLALRLQDLGGVTGRAVINGLVITPRGAGDPKRFDFGETDSPVAAGYDQVTESDAYSALAGYGWQAGDVTDQDRRFPELHTNFKLSSGGEYLGLVGPDGTVAQDFGVEYPPQVTDVSFGIPAGGSAAVFLATPTPGGPNSRARSAQVLFDRESGVFDSPFPLSLSVDAPGATIHYTTDGTVPTESSPVYTGPITIDLPVNVQAIAIAPQSATSAVTSAWFMKMGSDLANFSSDLPIVALDNFASPPRAGVFRFSALTIFEPDEVTGRSGLFAPPDLVTRSGIKVRGSSTAGREKASYAFEAWDDQDRDKDISPLGLPSESDWILYGPYDFDLALMRNAFIFELSNQVGRWAPRTRFVEVFFNRDGGELSADDYRGVYVLMEKIKRGPDRVDIANLTPADNSEPEISGGWILKQDRADGDRGFGTDSGRTILYVDPKEVEVTPEQAVWIKNDFDRMFASLSDTNPETGYEQTIDVDSWIDHSILNVLPMNVDAYRLSAFFYKDRGGKYEMGPIWDFDRTMGSEDGLDARIDAWSGTGDSSRFFEDNVQYPWWGILEDDPNYMQRWIDRWFELRETVLSEENIDQIIDSMAAELEEAQGRNYERWSDLRLNGGDFAEPNAQTWWGEVRHLKGWLHARLAWIDSQFPPRPTVSPGAGRIPIGQRIQLSADSGTVYFTTDGSDPRLPGGGVNPSAIAAEPTVQLIFAGSLHVVARTERDGQWSPMLEPRFFIAGVPDDATELSISEINYAPHAPTAAERAIDPGLNRGDFEFIEIVNQGDHTIDLEGVRFS